MTDEQMRVAILEATGKFSVWLFHDGVVEITFSEATWPKQYKAERVGWERAGEAKDLSGLPDYLNDLNAMHKAEKKMLTDEQYKRYRNLLEGLCNRDADIRCAAYEIDPTSATARQRAQAFIATVCP